MKTSRCFWNCVAAMTAWVFVAGCASDKSGSGAPAGGGTALVTFVTPDRYTDLQLSGMTRPESSAMLIPDLERHIRRVAAASLPAGQTLDVRVLDIDQAGFLRLVNQQMIRVDLNSQPARIDLEFTLKDGAGTVLKSGQKSLTGFFTPGRDSLTWKDELGLLRRLLSDWIRSLGGN